ncbi:IS3 family transposase, partial [Pseudomonas aeruginosa]|nr:IS3 family transposase [Pseudomonas aeruginosa]
MRELGLVSKQPGSHAYKQATVERPDNPNRLNREFATEHPNQVWCGDITYVWAQGRRGNCWDNAVVESFFSSLKKERIRKRIYKTRDMARADIFDYIEVFYNRTRRHSHLGGVSPEAFESASL